MPLLSRIGPDHFSFKGMLLWTNSPFGKNVVELRIAVEVAKDEDCSQYQETSLSF